MKKYFFLIFSFVLFVGFFVLIGFQPERQSLPEPSVQPFESSSNVNELEIKYKGIVYKLAWSFVANPKKIVLGANLGERKTAKSLYDENRCVSLVNGGFYTQDNDYIGLMYVDGKKLSNESNNALYNGVFYVTKQGDVGIGNGVPLEPVRYAVQSGPLLVRYQAYQKLQIANDETERRTLVGVTNKKEVYFISVYKPESAFLGPRLADLPQILKEFAESKKVVFVDALNLDGGAHSAHLAPEISLDELSTIGSYLCAK